MSQPDRTPAWHSPDTVPATSPVIPCDQPQQIGRYRVERLLGKGGFGRVYLAHDQELKHRVAIKVPHRRLVSGPEQAEVYLEEARTVASLDHPNIVPVYNVDRTADYPFFLVSKYIEGTTLAERIKVAPPSFGAAAELVAAVAEALHYAHKQGIVHRDIKPGNILLDKSDKPYVADFGLALKEENVGTGPKYAGTPSYMSPEQARGEGHRVDGRSDIFALGIVFYELLTGRRPFRSKKRDKLLELIATLEARPPRQVDDSIPKMLERICLKALSKRASDRYTTAKDLADDIRHFLAHAPECEISRTGMVGLRDSGAFSTPGLGRGSTSAGPAPIKIVPKGLRSFDAHDADFFLELLPGARDRDGSPDSIRFWKTRIEETDVDATFEVGLIYGPSGCGKSSLVKAGLLPRLSDNIVTLYVEATAEETEVRLLKAIRKISPDLTGDGGLVEGIVSLRRGHEMLAGKKVLIVLDQFEQWLHAGKEKQGAELVRALRQCDGEHVQCIVMVRDDFWLAVSRFMQDLEVELVPGRNIGLVDLFDLDHARKVLGAFGRAFGKLPETPRENSKDQKEFLRQAVHSLSQEDKVNCARLALFAEMMKGKQWSPSTLRKEGGTEGVGVAFLEETFSLPTANPKYRLHQEAARSVLQALLPELGTDIKGHMQPYEELLRQSGYENRRKDFNNLIRTLDGELHLITPSDLEDREAVGDSSSELDVGQRYYQLTHDYLVHSLRDWLTRKQKETERGRAELLLADRANLWNARPENRLLPSLWLWGSFLVLTRRKSWSPPQRNMMRAAGRYHAMHGLVLTLVLAGCGIGAWIVQGRITEQSNVHEAASLVKRLVDADVVQVPGIISEMSRYRRWVEPLLKEENQNPTANPRAKLYTSLALVPMDETQVDYLYSRLLDAEPREVPIIRDALADRQAALVDKLWAVVENPGKGNEPQRLPAAAALARYDESGPNWTWAGQRVTNDLVAVPAAHLSLWMDLLRPVRTKLLPHLSAVYRDRQRRETERSLATNILADYAAAEPRVLADLLMSADEKQFALIYPKLAVYGPQALTLLTAELTGKVRRDATTDVKDELAKRQANASIALLKLNQPAQVWPLLKRSPDPSVRTYLIHGFGPLGVDSSMLVNQLDLETDAGIRQALILSLGPDEFPEQAWSPGERAPLVRRLQDLYLTSTDTGDSCLGGMAVAAMASRQMAGPDQRGMGEEAGEAEKGGGWRGRNRLIPSPATLYPPLHSGTSTVRDKRWW